MTLVIGQWKWPVTNIFTPYRRAAFEVQRFLCLKWRPVKLPTASQLERWAGHRHHHHPTAEHSCTHTSSGVTPEPSDASLQASTTLLFGPKDITTQKNGASGDTVGKLSRRTYIVVEEVNKIIFCFAFEFFMYPP